MSDNSKATQNTATIQSDIELLLPEVTQQMDSIIALSNSITIQGRTLTTGEIELVARIEGLKKPWESWQKNYAQLKALDAAHALNQQDQLNFLKQLLTQLQSLADMAAEISF